MNFNQLIQNENLLRAISEIGYETPSDIQSQSIPYILEGHDLIGQSQTGSGKTAAFGLPVLSNISPNASRKPQALVLCPTRELCLQVADEMRKFGKYLQGVRIVSVYGGQEITKQIKDIKGGAEVVVATPGRLLDHMRRRTLRFDQCHTVILDEADEMLNMGFLDEVKDVFAGLPENRQTILFSATMPKPIMDLSKEILHNPKQIRIERKSLTVSTIEQIAYEVLPSQKNDLTIQVLELTQAKSTLIFCNTKKMVDELSSFLNKQGYNSLALHGDIKQEMRTHIMRRFKEKQASLLIATDVAARGIDVDDLDLVLNYDIPQELEYYVHRIGRTGRAGKSGQAITFVSPRQRQQLAQIEKLSRSSIQLKATPTQEELSTLTTSLIEKEIKTGLQRHNTNIDEVINSLYQNGLNDDQIIHGLLGRVVEAHLLKAIEPVKSSSRQTRDKKKNLDYSTLVINLGKKHDIAPANIIAAIAESCNISGRDIGKIKISDRSSTVEIPSNLEKQIVETLLKTQIKGKIPYVSVAKKPARSLRKKNSRH